MQLAILSGGAAQGLVQALSARFKTETGCEIAGTFGAVGAMRDKLIAGAPADLVILTSALIAELMASGHVTPAAKAEIGVVRTAVAVRAGDPVPQIGDEAALRVALLGADEIHLADPKLATAGIHFAKVLAALGFDESDARLRLHPNGMTAMRALAQSRGRRPIGCTQVTEIVATPGVALAGPLPKAFELATIYTAGICTAVRRPVEARRFATLLTGEETRDARQRAGFEPLGQTAPA